MAKVLKNLECPVCLKKRLVSESGHGEFCRSCSGKKAALRYSQAGKRKYDLIGKRFGRLLVLSLGFENGGKAGYVCRCDCGKEIRVCTTRLRSKAVSCSCIVATQKGLATSLSYASYKGMIARCCKKECKSFFGYGKRGIKVCDRWKESFLNFFEDMGERKKGYSIERIDVNGDYCKENCRWATNEEQNYNKRNTVLIEAFGKKLNKFEWEKETGINRRRIDDRLRKGMTAERALTQKVRISRKK